MKVLSSMHNDTVGTYSRVCAYRERLLCISSHQKVDVMMGFNYSSKDIQVQKCGAEERQRQVLNQSTMDVQSAAPVSSLSCALPAESLLTCMVKKAHNVFFFFSPFCSPTFRIITSEVDAALTLPTNISRCHSSFNKVNYIS